MDDADRLNCDDVVCDLGGHYACHDLPPPKPLHPRVHPLLEDIKRGAHQRKVYEMEREQSAPHTTAAAGLPCGGPAPPQTFHWGPHPDCPECGPEWSPPDSVEVSEG